MNDGLAMVAGWLALLQNGLTDHLFTRAVLWQLAGLGVLAVVVYLVARPMRPAIVRWIGEHRPESPTGRLAQAGLNQLASILFLIPLWLAIGLLAQLDLAEESNFLIVVASLLNAWVLIRVTSRLIANRLLANLIFLFAWSVAALNVLGLLGAAMDMLDAVAVPVGAARVSLLTVFNVALLFALLLWLALTASRLIQNQIHDHADISPRAQVLLGKVVRFSMIALAVVIALASVGTNFAALAVFTGALGVGIGIGLQTQVSNLLSGLFLLLDKSVKPGDVIEVGDTFGWVKDMHARYVGVITRDNKEHLIPNDDFVTNQVVNWSHSEIDVRMEIEFGVSYASDPHLVRRLAGEAALGASPRVVQSKQPLCHLVGFGDSSLDFVLRFWIEDPQNGVTNVKGLVFLALWDKLKEHGVEIPYPHRHIVLDNPSPDGLPSR